LKFIGIDLAGSQSRPTGFCELNDRKNTRCRVLFSDAEILAAVTQSRGRVAAVDAPLALPFGRHCLEEHCRGRSHFRVCDLVLTRMRIRGFPLTIGPMRTLTSRGIRIARQLRHLGLSVVETYPGAAQDILGIPRKQYGLESLQSGLVDLGCGGDLRKRKLTGDELDAVNCALVAKEYASGSYLAIGDPSEIMMILPKMSPRSKPPKQ
jgi:predicted nuclease with RNAse H fold